MTTTVKKGYVNGSDLLIKVDGQYLASCTSHTSNFNSETKERAVKPPGAASIGSGRWKEKTVVGQSISITGEGLRCFSAGGAGYKALLAAWKSGESIEVEAIERESTAPYLKGMFVIASLEESAPAGDDATYSISLENDGEPEVLDATKITETTEDP